MDPFFYRRANLLIKISRFHINTTIAGDARADIFHPFHEHMHDQSLPLHTPPGNHAHAALDGFSIPFVHRRANNQVGGAGFIF